MTILLLGANGQVGRELRAALAPLAPLALATRNGCLDDGSQCIAADLADPASLASALDAAGADVIVNAAAWTAVDGAEDQSDLADRINHHAVGEIAAWAARHAARVVHYSTDYVFDGRARRPYREDDATAPLGVYGRSKLAGEEALRASGAAHTVLRTAWVHAAHGHNFLLTMLRLARERDELRVVADQIGAPTPATLIAAVTAALLSCDDDRDGTWHLCSAGQCSWFEFACAIMAGAQAAGLIAQAPRVTPIATADHPTAAARPAYSILDCGKLQRDFGLDLPDWRHGLAGTIADLAARDTER
jgi:dTDP-4-dehydrorhamnose reductase